MEVGNHRYTPTANITPKSLLLIAFSFIGVIAYES